MVCNAGPVQYTQHVNDNDLRKSKLNCLPCQFIPTLSQNPNRSRLSDIFCLSSSNDSDIKTTLDVITNYLILAYSYKLALS